MFEFLGPHTFSNMSEMAYDMSTRSDISHVMSDLEKFGRIYSSSVLFIALVVAITSVISGVIVMRRDTAYDRITQGVVTSLTSCDNTGKELKCATTVAYMVGTTTYSITVTNAKIHKQGDKVLVKYKSSSPGDAKLGVSMPKKQLGWALIGGGILFLMIAALIWYVVQNYRTAALLQGTRGGLNLLRGLSPI